MSRSSTYISAGLDSRSSRGFRMIMAGSMCAAIAGLASVRAEADSAWIRAASSGWGARNSDRHRSTEMLWGTPTAEDKIKFSSDLRVEGGASQPTNPRAEEKFAFPGATGKDFVGFSNRIGPGSAGSRMTSRGWGVSYIGRVGFRVVTWEIRVRGNLGTGNQPWFRGMARTNDPFFITPDQLAEVGVTENRYDVTVGAGLDAGTAVSGSGEISLDVYYDVAEGITNLLSIRINGSEISATNDDPPGLSFYRLDSMDERPSETPEDRITLDEIRDVLLADIGADGVLDTPLYLGIVWEDVPVPTVELLPEQGHGYYVDGTLGMFRIESEANELAAGPGACADPYFIPWDEHLDMYVAGEGLIGNCGWKGFDGDPGLDAIVAPFPMNHTPNSLDIRDEANVLREFEGATSGLCMFQTWQFIPGDYTSGGSGPLAGSHLVLFNTYRDGGPYHPSVDIQVDSNDEQIKFYCANGNTPFSVPYIVDQWVPIEIIVDLDNDFTFVFYDQQPICEYQWTAGAFGNGGGALELKAVDLYAQGSDSVFYDDMVLTPLDEPCDPADMNCDGTVNANDIEPFLGILFEGEFPCLGCTGDLNGDGNIDALDIEGFLARLFR